MSALLSATAGFLISQSHIFNVKSPADSFRMGFFLLVYSMLFASVPLAVAAGTNLLRGGRSAPFWLSLACFFSGLYEVGRNVLFTETAGDSLLNIRLVDPSDRYALPLLILPVIWALVHLLDEAISRVS